MIARSKPVSFFFTNVLSTESYTLCSSNIPCGQKARYPLYLHRKDDVIIFTYLEMVFDILWELGSSGML